MWVQACYALEQVWWALAEFGAHLVHLGTGLVHLLQVWYTLVHLGTGLVQIWYDPPVAAQRPFVPSCAELDPSTFFRAFRFLFL